MPLPAAPLIHPHALPEIFLLLDLSAGIHSLFTHEWHPNHVITLLIAKTMRLSLGSDLNTRNPLNEWKICPEKELYNWKCHNKSAGRNSCDDCSVQESAHSGTPLRELSIMTVFLSGW